MGKNLRLRDAVTWRLGMGHVSKACGVITDWPGSPYRYHTPIHSLVGMAPHWGKCIFLASESYWIGERIEGELFLVSPGVLGTLMTSSVSASGGGVTYTYEIHVSGKLTHDAIIRRTWISLAQG